MADQAILDALRTRASNLERYPFESATMGEAARLAANALRNIAREFSDEPCDCEEPGEPS